jgi:hypothetical protein
VTIAFAMLDSRPTRSPAAAARQNRRRAIVTAPATPSGRPSTRPPRTAMASVRLSISATKKPSTAMITRKPASPPAEPLSAPSSPSPKRTLSAQNSAAAGPTVVRTRKPM